LARPDDRTQAPPRPEARACRIRPSSAGADAMTLLKHLTHIDGTTTADIAKATGLPVAQIRTELAALEREGKAVRERGRIGYPHLWWRADRKPLADDVVVLCMGLAAAAHRSSGKLRAVLARLATRAADP